MQGAVESTRVTVDHLNFNSCAVINIFYSPFSDVPVTTNCPVSRVDLSKKKIL